MAELAALLGTISVLLTFVASYRLFDFLTSGSPMISLLVAAGVTVSFMLVFEYVLVLFGLGTLAAPFAIVYYRRGRLPVVSKAVEQSALRAKRAAAQGIGWVKRTVGVDVSECVGCSTLNDATSDYCKSCGRKLEGSDT